MKKRKIDTAVLSDVHLGTFGCHAEELLIYLNSIQPKRLVLNGDIVDIRHERKQYFPPTHMKVLRKIIGMASKGTEVYYITGNHDERLRKFGDMSMGNLHVQHKLVLILDGKKVWFFHGGAYDVSGYNPNWFGELGSFGYKLFTLVNRIGKRATSKLGRDKQLASKQIKEGPNDTINLASHFKTWATDLAIKKGCDYVVCGHTHQPEKERVVTKKGQCTYLNSGDWMENLTALEYSFKRWKIYRYNHDKLSPFFADEEIKQMDMHELVASITTATAANIQKAGGDPLT